MLSRRAALGRLIGGAVTAPAIAKQAAASIAASVGIRGQSQGRFLPALHGIGESGEAQALHTMSRMDVVRLLRREGVPDWKRQEWRDFARHVTAFDPDLAAMQSVSVAAKIHLQRERNEAACERHFFTRFIQLETRERWLRARQMLGFGYL